MKSHGRIFVRLAEKVAVIDFLSESFHCRDNKMIRQISACVGRRGWLEFGLSARQESEHGEQSQKPAQLRLRRQCQVCSLHIHLTVSWYTLCLCSIPQDFQHIFWCYKKSYLRAEMVQLYPAGTQSQVYVVWMGVA